MAFLPHAPSFDSSDNTQIVDVPVGGHFGSVIAWAWYGAEDVSTARVE